MTTPDLSVHFALDPELIYLNHAAVAPWPTVCVDAVQRFAAENARSGAFEYPRWAATESRLRANLARLINAPSANDIALLKNTSEALSVVAYGLPWQPGDNVVISDQEFPSNRIVWESLARQGVETRRVDLRRGQSPEHALLESCDSRTRLLSISSVQYATGLRMNLEFLGTKCRTRKILFCIDAIQSIGALPFDAQASQADFVAADAHKWLLGPEGIAVFYCRSEVRDQLRLNQFGWHMVEKVGDYTRDDWSPALNARRFECGSPNMLGIHAFDASVTLLLSIGMLSVSRAVLSHTDYLLREISNRHSLELITDAAEDRRSGIVTFRSPQIDQKRLYETLMAKRVFCAARGGGIRFSPHFHTPREQLARALGIVDDVLAAA